MNVLDLFSGIGGFSLGLERAGMRTVAFCEIEPFCRAVLRKHWPGVPIYEDIRDFSAKHLSADGITVDLICGGFPCQDISFAGKGAGIEGKRSSLWSDYARIIGEVRPRYVIVENVAALLGRGLERVLGDLAALGFDAEWHCISASAIGAPHIRDRIWILAYTRQKHFLVELPKYGSGAAQQSKEKQFGITQFQNGLKFGMGFARSKRWWINKPPICGMVNDVPNRLDRIGTLGNAAVPQIPEIIGRAIIAAENDHRM